MHSFQRCGVSSLGPTVSGEMALAAPFWREEACRSRWGLDVLVLYAAEPGGKKDQSWNDGFVAALRLLQRWGHLVTWLNTDAADSSAAFKAAAPGAGVILAKSNWGWKVDRFLRSHAGVAGPASRRAIMVSGISSHIGYRRGRFYDVVFFQTNWYKPRLSPRLLAVHAYGINTDEMYPPVARVTPEWDWLYVGALTRQRRADRLLGKEGRRLAIGELGRSDPSLVAALERDGVVVQDFVPYPELREIYWRARRLYVPAALDGGGERQVMEAMACGLPVALEPDNPKLREVVENAGYWTESYYARQLELGLSLVARNAT